jgi:soluble lytic murein transglycosylase-like protein
VAACESTMNPNAYNAGNYGLFQVNAIHVSDPSALYDPETNVATAYRLYLARGWQPWGPCGAR